MEGEMYLLLIVSYAVDKVLLRYLRTNKKGMFVFQQ